MRKARTIILLLTTAALIAISAPCWAGTAGAFAKALKDRFCGGTAGGAWYGCYAYMHYRVDLNKNRDSAKSVCYKNGCGSKYGNTNPTQLTNCYKGCDQAYNADTQ